MIRQDGPNEHTEGQPATVLVVEDHAMVRITAALHLRDAGYAVREAASAAEAIDVMNQDPIDAVFCDVDMPGPLNGIGLAVWMERNCPGIPIVLTSGLGISLPPGTAFLAKPYRYSDLRAVIATALSNRSRAR